MIVSGKVVEFGQSFCIGEKLVVIGQKLLYSGKSGCILAKVVVFGQSCLIRAKVVVIGQGLFFGQSGCIWEKNCCNRAI